MSETLRRHGIAAGASYGKAVLRKKKKKRVKKQKR